MKAKIIFGVFAAAVSLTALAGNSQEKKICDTCVYHFETGKFVCVKCEKV